MRIVFLFLISSALWLNGKAQSWNWAEPMDCSNANYLILANSDGTYFRYGNFKDTLYVGTEMLVSQATGWDLFFAKYDALNNFLWAKSFGGADNYSSSTSIEGFKLKTDAHKNLILAGSFANSFIANQDTIRSINGWQDAFLAKCDSMGNFIWIKHLAGQAAEGFNQLSLDANDNIFASGGFIDYDHTDTLVYYFHELPTDTFIIPFSSYIDGYLFRFNPDGNVIWLNYWGGPEDDQSANQTIDELGNIYISEGIDSVTVDGTDTIRSLGMTDVIVRKFNSNGQRVWTKRYGDIRHDRFTLGKVIDNRIFIYGTIDSVTSFGSNSYQSIGWQDVYCAWMDTSGEISTLRHFGGDSSSTQPFFLVDVNASGDVYLPGSVYRSVTFDTAIVSIDSLEIYYLVILDSSLHLKKVFRSTDISTDMSFQKVYCTGSGAIVNGAFNDSANFSGINLIADTSCSYYQPFIASLNFTSSVNELNGDFNHVSIYPNPSDGNFTLSLETKQQGKYELRTYSILGTEILHIQIELAAGKNAIRINPEIKPLPGIYFVQIRGTNNEFLSGKIIIE